jgi:pyrimidine-specific ribonucleoside hydrolase
VAVPLIVDTDPGIDDAFALALAATHPNADLLAVTTTFGNVPLDVTTDNAQRILTLLNRLDVPLGQGSAQPLVHPVPASAAHVHGVDGLGGRAHDFAEVGRPVHDNAHDVMVRALDAATRPVVIVAIGPLTNLAVVLASRPDLVGKIGRLVVMGGAVSVPGNVTPVAEFNILCDPEAARRVLAAENVPVTLVPLDLTHQCTVDEDWLDHLARAGSTAGVLTHARETYLRYYEQSLGIRAVPIHDAIAMLAALEPKLFSGTPLHLDVDTSAGVSRGAIVADRRRHSPVYPGRPVDVATDTDPEMVRKALFSTISSLP